MHAGFSSLAGALWGLHGRVEVSRLNGYAAVGRREVEIGFVQSMTVES